ncbi:MAG TPA: hypothetical protein VGW34_03865 [Allosphingosinicella sp.]|nr:hypothetical protein [Allosphingosinicella sp.]
MPIDPYQGYTSPVHAQADNWDAVTPDDDEDLPNVPKALWANVAGDIALVGEDGHEEIFAVPASVPIPLRARRVKATGTTATGIRALY